MRCKNLSIFFRVLLLSIISLSFEIKAEAQILPRPDHIVILIEDSQPRSYIFGNNSALGDPQTYAPTFNMLAADTDAAVFTQMYAEAYPSQPDYLYLFSGANQGVTSDSLPTIHPFTTPNLAYQLISNGLSFKTYSQDLDAIGSNEASSVTGSYVRNHNPVTNWMGTGTNQVPDTLNQRWIDFPSNFSQLPTVSYIVPDEDSDMHYGTGIPPIESADTWFCEHLECTNSTTFMQWARAHNTLFIITFDEDNGGYGNNIPTLFFGPMVKGGTYAVTINHCSILKMIEDMYGLTETGCASGAAPINFCWRDTQPLPAFSVSLGPSPLSVCSGTKIIQAPVISGGQAPYSYAWSAAGSSLSCNNCADPSATITQNTTCYVTVTDANNATATDSVSYNISTSGTIQISASGPTSICAGHSVMLSTNQSYNSYNWSDGSTTSAITVSQQGTYTVSVATGTGCSATGTIFISLLALPPDQSVTGSTSIVPLQTYTYMVVNTIGVNYLWSVSGGTIEGGQGTNSLIVEWGSTGPYSVTLVQYNQQGCGDTLYLAAANTNCSLPYYVLSDTNQLLCTGDTALLIAQAVSGSTYQWLLNGSPITGATDDTLAVTGNGVYQVHIALDSCSVLSSSYSFTFIPSPTAPVISSTGNTASCISPSVILSVPNNYSGYNWSTGAGDTSIVATASGVYTVTATGANGCQVVSQPDTVNLSIVTPYQICVVSVDSTTGENIVVWNVPSRVGVDSFLIYKETNVQNVFAEVGSVYVDSFSTFIDYSSAPQQQSSTYTLAVLDTCGNITLQSAPHQTIYLTVNQGTGSAWNLAWNAYEGFTYSSYYIYRGTAATSLQQIATISAGNLSYTDINPPGLVSYYAVEVINPNGCSPSRSSDYNVSMSNIVQVINTGISAVNDNSDWQIYPNPVHDYLLVRNNNLPLAAGYRAKVINTLGQVVSVQEIKGTETKMDITGWGTTAGVYFMEITNAAGQKVEMKKIVLE